MKMHSFKIYNTFVSLGNHTIAIVKGKEEHETLKESLANVIKEVNRLANEGHVIVDNTLGTRQSGQLQEVVAMRELSVKYFYCTLQI